jgi:hypothetical protein
MTPNDEKSANDEEFEHNDSACRTLANYEQKITKNTKWFLCILRQTMLAVWCGLSIDCLSNIKDVYRLFKEKDKGLNHCSSLNGLIKPFSPES